jgi:hypothetical protein
MRYTGASVNRGFDLLISDNETRICLMHFKISTYRAECIAGYIIPEFKGSMPTELRGCTP